MGYSDLNTDENCPYDFDIHEDLLIQQQKDLTKKKFG